MRGKSGVSRTAGVYRKVPWKTFIESVSAPKPAGTGRAVRRKCCFNATRD